MKSVLWAALAAIGAGAQTLPVRPGPSNMVSPPAISRDGRVIVFASTMAPDGSETRSIADLYVYNLGSSSLRALTRLPSETPAGPPRGVSSVALSAGGDIAAYVHWTSTGRGEEVHVVHIATGDDVKAAEYNEGCIQPLCLECAIPCVYSPHLSPDGQMVLYAAGRDKPFYLAKTDGSQITHLPVFSGSLAPGPQRVISDGGRVVFTSSAPFGPTLAPQANDVYTMNLEGGDIRQVTKFGSNASIFSQNATIAADGSLIAFESNFDPDTNGAGEGQVWIVRPDGSGLLRLTTGIEAATNPSISADGALVVFERSGQLQVADTASGTISNFTKYEHSRPTAPDLSGDGAWAAYALGPRGGNRSAIYARNVRTLEERAVFAPRLLNAGGVTSAATGADAASRGITSVYGVNFTTGDHIAAADSFPLPATLAGVSALVNGQAAPLLAVTPWQINLQTPEAPEGAAKFQVRDSKDALTNTVEAAIKAVSPAPFAFAAHADDGAGTYRQAAAFHAGTATPADDSHPAAPGEILEVYGTGLGPTNPTVPVGAAAPATPLAETTSAPEVLIGEATARVLFSGLTPGLAGVYQINVELPASLKPGRYPMTMRMGQTSPPATATITVR